MRINETINDLTGQSTTNPRNLIIVPTEDEFFSKYRLETNTFTEDSPFENKMFETWGEQYDKICTVNNEFPTRIWTLVEADGNQYISAGFHIVNRMGYFITETDWQNETEEYLVKN